MGAPLSIIIPTYNSEQDLPATVASLFEGLEDGLIRELVICDSSQNNAMEIIADKLGSVYLRVAKGRGNQLKEGASHSIGAWMLFLHADTHLAEGWSEIVGNFITNHPDQAGYFRLKFRQHGFFPSMVARWANLRSVLFNLPYGDQGLLISRSLYEQIGGFQPMPLMEDVDICRKLRGKLKMINGLASTSAHRQISKGWLTSGFGNLWILAQYFCGKSPRELYKKYY